MKELSIEEKAKAYDYAVNKAKELILNENGVVRVDKPLFDELFPSEMEESEDERIRKKLIKAVKGDMVVGGTKDKQLAIAWLEKQGKPKEINPSEFDSQLNRLLGQFKSLPKEELASSLSFYLNVVQNDGTYKEEKQGEQKPIPKFEVGDVMRTLQEAADNITSGLPIVVSIDDEFYLCNNELIAIKDQDDYEYPPMNRIQKQKWSEEDEANFQCALSYVNSNPLLEDVNVENCRTWLKSLKFRVQSKQEWSGKDERYVKDLADYFTGGHPLKYAEEDIADWFKSLKDRYAWKPSEEMLEALDIAIRVGIQLGSWEEKALRELQKQLKAL